jgi:hypothetical protein
VAPCGLALQGVDGEATRRRLRPWPRGEGEYGLRHTEDGGDLKETSPGAPLRGSPADCRGARARTGSCRPWGSALLQDLRAGSEGGPHRCKVRAGGEAAAAQWGGGGDEAATTWWSKAAMARCASVGG